jgi:hypothetical protein
MNQELKNFTEDLIKIIQEKYNESLSESKKLQSEADAAYQLGLNFAYYDMLDLIDSQLTAFGFRDEVMHTIAPELGKHL